MLPTMEEAHRLLADAEICNPGPWGDHSRVAAHCARCIAGECPGLEEEKAYILGLLHDIGRKFGVRHLGHVSDGYRYMCELGYDEVARVCLTHSFNNYSTSEYIGKFDTTPEELALIQTALVKTVPDDYDRLIQLCDALAGNDRVLDIETRMADVRRRYGAYPEAKWNRNLELKAYFESRTGRDIYEVTRQSSFRIPK